jgi:hypothetical protein
VTHQRVFGGQADLTGRNVGTLFIQGVITVHPVLRYFALCRMCNTQTQYTHTELIQGGKCKQPQCGLERERQELERQDIMRRQAARTSWLGERYD